MCCVLQAKLWNIFKAALFTFTVFVFFSAFSWQIESHEPIKHVYHITCSSVCIIACETLCLCLFSTRYTKHGRNKSMAPRHHSGQKVHSVPLKVLLKFHCNITQGQSFLLNFVCLGWNWTWPVGRKHRSRVCSARGSLQDHRSRDCFNSQTERPFESSCWSMCNVLMKMATILLAAAAYLSWVTWYFQLTLQQGLHLKQ